MYIVVLRELYHGGAQQISSNIIQHQRALSQMQIEAFVRKTVENMLPGILEPDGKAENAAADLME